MEDGTGLSLWLLRGSCLVVAVVSGFLAIATFNGIGPFDRSSQVALWIVFLIFNLFCVVVYVLLQFFLVIVTLDDRWPLGAIMLGSGFFAAGVTIMVAFSAKICDAVKHYIDGLFFVAICNLLAVMMVYKYWDSITKEDLEMSVGGAQNIWEVKDLMEEEDYGAMAMGGGRSYDPTPQAMAAYPLASGYPEELYGYQPKPRQK